MAEWFSEFKVDFTNNFITDNRWQYLTDGLLVTLEITLFAVLMGIIIGFVLAIIRTTYDKTGKLKILNLIAKVYITIIRGTPVVLQLLIIYYVVFATVPINKVVAAVIAFGLNSGAYVAEIVRSGIMSIDPGQMEAGRSLGLSYSKTMWYIVLPQAFKTVLPALGNEFITLLKETSVCGYIALVDLTKGGDYIRSRTYDAFLPYIAVALIYLGIVMLLSYFVGRLERRLRKSDRS
ncbi:MAG: amino acid ABC transporter permease [Clostridia bacterium]